MKSFTDLEQSKKLAEILPLESADMYYKYVLPKSNIIEHNPQNGSPVEALKWYNKGYSYSDRKPLSLEEYCIPCWSLAALLSILPTIDDRNAEFCKDIRYDKWHVFYHSTATLPLIDTERYHDVIDACYEMILKLHKLKLL